MFADPSATTAMLWPQAPSKRSCGCKQASQEILLAALSTDKTWHEWTHRSAIDSSTGRRRAQQEAGLPKHDSREPLSLVARNHRAYQPKVPSDRRLASGVHQEEPFTHPA